MPHGLGFLRYHIVQIAIGLTLAAIAVTLFRVFRKRISQEEMERHRRLLVHQQGRLIDGVILDIHDESVYFGYCVNGVDYQATQDITSLREFLPAEPHRAIGPATLKYLARNPANSIVVCEYWSGFRERTGL